MVSKFTIVAGVKGRPGRNKMVRATNLYQKGLLYSFDVFSSRLDRKVKAAIREEKSTDQIKEIVDQNVAQLIDDLKQLNHAALLDAWLLGNGGPPDSRGLKVISEHMDGFDNAVSNKLAPEIKRRVQIYVEQAKAGFVQLAVEWGSILEAVAACRSNLGSGGGGFWVMIFEGLGMKVRDEDEKLAGSGGKPLRVKWVLDPGAQHCKGSPGFHGCPDLAGEYDTWDDMPTVPAGEVSCRGNCRCHIEVYKDGQWQTGV